MLPQTVPGFLDTSPIWWMRCWHRLLDECGAPRVEGESTELRMWNGARIIVDTEVGFFDCDCRECKRICS